MNDAPMQHGVKPEDIHTDTASGAGTKNWPGFLDCVPGLGPGCVVTDVRMPEMDGLELQRRLIERDATLSVIVITGHGDVPIAVQAPKAGAVDFIEKPFGDDILLAAVSAALMRNRADLRSKRETNDLAARLEALTTREREVLSGLVAGLPNKALAYDLGISARTVEFHRVRVMEKMRARGLSDLQCMVAVTARLENHDLGPTIQDIR
jgi:two-component system response regulator FixJ